MQTCLPLAGAILLLLGISDIAAQQLPPATGPIPQLRRTPDGQIEAVTPNAKPPQTTAPRPPKPRSQTTLPGDPTRPEASTIAPAGNPTRPDASTISRPTSGTTPAAPEPLKAAITPRPAEISLPEPLAVEMPPGSILLVPSEPPLRGLLAKAVSGERRVTNDQTLPVRVGPVRITFTAWQGEPWSSAPVGIRTAVLHVLPTGTTPVGVSGDDNATTNTSTKIARDPSGRVHLVWLDSGRSGTSPRVLYRRATVSPDNTVTWETDSVRVSEEGADPWNAYPGLAVVGNTVHFVWQGERTARYRQLFLEDGAWRWGPVRDTKAPSEGRDTGPVIAAMPGGLLHIATPSGFDAVSLDNGETWKSERIPLPPGRRTKTVSVALDHLGNAHFALSAPVRGPEAASEKKASRGYWELRYIRRSADSTWSVSENVLGGEPEWAEPKGDDDVLADWVHILADDADNLHLSWHGTAETRIYGNDHAYYIRRARGAGSWEKPISLMPHPEQGFGPFSFSPSLALSGETAVAVPFYGVSDGDRWVGFDALARIIRNGTADARSIPITNFSRQSIEQRAPETALSARFPAAAPQLYRDAQGRIWLDLLETLIPYEEGPKLIVYQRVDVTAAIGGK
jgi:hypothetical protein